MEFVTNEKLTIVGAAGMIGSNMAQTAIMMGLTPNICLYDPYAPGLEGVAEELFHCGFEGMNITFTSDIKEALTDAKYIVNSGGAARKAGMTREDLLKGNAAIAEEFGKNVKAYCPDVTLRPSGRSILRTFPFTTLLHNPRRQPRPFFYNLRRSRHHNPRGQRSRQT